MLVTIYIENGPINIKCDDYERNLEVINLYNWKENKDGQNLVAEFRLDQIIGFEILRGKNEQS